MRDLEELKINLELAISLLDKKTAEGGGGCFLSDFKKV